MPRAVITLHDDGGSVAMTMYLEGGYQADSNAHQTANIVVKHLDDMASIKARSETKWVEGNDAQWIGQSVVAVPDAMDDKSRAARIGLVM